jgi:hypothetical protein
VTLTCRSVDRIFLQAYVPKLQTVVGMPVPALARGYLIPSSAVFGKIGQAYADELHRFAKAASRAAVLRDLAKRMTCPIGRIGRSKAAAS